MFAYGIHNPPSARENRPTQQRVCVCVMRLILVWKQKQTYECIYCAYTHILNIYISSS